MRTVRQRLQRRLRRWLAVAHVGLLVGLAGCFLTGHGGLKVAFAVAATAVILISAFHWLSIQCPGCGRGLVQYWTGGMGHIDRLCPRCGSDLDQNG
jgi:hypothetical protein